MPLSWRHFNVGMGLIGRETARATLRLYQALSMAQSLDKTGARERWVETQRQAAGW
jgi:hypothetical protein